MVGISISNLKGLHNIKPLLITFIAKIHRIVNEANIIDIIIGSHIIKVGRIKAIIIDIISNYDRAWAGFLAIYRIMPVKKGGPGWLLSWHWQECSC